MAAFRTCFSRLLQLSACRRNASTYKNVIVEDKGSVRIVTINRPESKNCVNSETADELYAAFRGFEEDSTVSVGILVGKGNTFCTGYDLKELSGMSEPPPFEPFAMNSKGPMGPSRLLLTKPVIACLTGYAVAGGLELALWCDMRVAEKTVKMGVFSRRYGVPLIDGGTVRLPMAIGLSRAMDLVLTGREISAAEGLKIGLINRVVCEGKGLEESIILANQIAAFPQTGLRGDRMSLINSTACLEQTLKFEFEHGTSNDIINECINNAKKFNKQK